MEFLRKLHERQAKLFEKGGKFERFYPLWEAHDTFVFTPGKVTKSAAHVRDAVDLKRVMSIVVAALIPCVLMAIYNTGLQANLGIAAGGSPIGWRGAAIEALGVGFNPDSVFACVVHGLFWYLPMVIVTLVAGGFWEALFAIVRRHEINEGFLVTWMLFPLIMPPAVPLWQVALGISFGVVLGKEVFGGTGMNIWNPALTGRAFLFFAYPAQFSGDLVYAAADGYSAATSLARVADAAGGGVAAITSTGLTWWDAFLGFMPGSMGETSALAALIGALIIAVTGVGSWRIMLGGVIGMAVMATGLNMIGSDTNPAFSVPFYWHLVLGSFAFGMAFMATDPVSAPYTNRGRLIYGALIGVLIVLVRVVNPAFTEGTMLAILLMNVFSRLIDHFVVQSNVKKRKARYAAV